MLCARFANFGHGHACYLFKSSTYIWFIYLQILVFCLASFVFLLLVPCRKSFSALHLFFLAVAPICRATREYRLPFLYNCMSKDRHALAILSTLIACVLRGWPLRLPCAFYSSHTSFILLNPSHLAQVITRRTIHRPRQSI